MAGAFAQKLETACRNDNQFTLHAQPVPDDNEARLGSMRTGRAPTAFTGSARASAESGLRPVGVTLRAR